MTLDEAKIIIEAVKLNPPLAGYTNAQVCMAISVLGGTHLAPPTE